MSDVLEHTTEGQALLARGEAQGEARGRTAGAAEGRTVGAAEGLRVLLAERFGDADDLAAISLALAEQGFAEGLRRIRAADTLADLRG